MRLISFKSDDLHWQPGDVLVVRPQNSDEQVNELFDIFKEHNFDFDANTIVKLKEIDAGKKIAICSYFYHSVFYLKEKEKK